MLTFTRPENINFEEIGRLRQLNKTVPVTSDINLSLPHDIYAFDLKSLRDQENPVPVVIGQRMIETDGEHFVSIFDHYPYETSPGIQMRVGKEFLDSCESALEIASSFDGEITAYTVRLLKVSALYVEAIWLVDEKNMSNDKFILIRHGHVLETNTVYDRDTFIKTLRVAATAKVFPEK